MQLCCLSFISHTTILSIPILVMPSFLNISTPLTFTVAYHGFSLQRIGSSIITQWDIFTTCQKSMSVFCEKEIIFIFDQIFGSLLGRENIYSNICISKPTTTRKCQVLVGRGLYHVSVYHYLCPFYFSANRRSSLVNV